MSDSLMIWYVHAYAGGPGVGRHWRPYSFAREWQSRGHDCVVYTSSYHHLMEPDEPRSGRSNHAGVIYRFARTFRYVGNGWGRILSMIMFSASLFWAGLREAKNSKRPDLIIYSSPHLFGFVACWILAKLMRCRLFLEVRDLWPLSLVEIAGASPRHPLVVITGALERFAYRRSDRVISLLPAAEPHMLDRGLPRGRFCWIPNGVSRGELSEALEPSLAVSALASRIRELQRCGKKVFIYAGAHGRPNGLHAILDTARLLKEEGFSEAAFVLVGAGDEKAALIARGRAEQLDAVHFMEQCQKPEVLAGIRVADAACMVLAPVSTFRFGVSPNKLFDYMSCGLPIIAMYSAANDPVAEAQCGVSVQAGDVQGFASAVKRLCSMSEEQRSEIGRRGRRIVEKDYSHEVLSERYLATYREACADVDASAPNRRAADEQ